MNFKASWIVRNVKSGNNELGLYFQEKLQIKIKLI